MYKTILSMDFQSKCNILSSISDSDFENKLRKLELYKKEIVAYDGFEPSGRIHIAQGILRTINTNKITSLGYKFKFLIADMHASLNLKYNGDQQKIEDAGNLIIETFKACGMNMQNIEFLWSSKEINKNPAKYWSIVLDISKYFTIQESLEYTNKLPNNIGNLKIRTILYPILQCADIFYFNFDICSMGEDQYNINKIAEKYSEKVNKKTSPLILSHKILLGLDGSNKMSKSQIKTSIYMDDTEDDIKYKIKKCFCPPYNNENNPILEYYKYLIFEYYQIVNIKKKNKDIKYIKYLDFEKDYLNRILTPKEIKDNLNLLLNSIIQPVREYFKNNEYAYNLREKVKSYEY